VVVDCLYQSGRKPINYSQLPARVLAKAGYTGFSQQPVKHGCFTLGE